MDPILLRMLIAGAELAGQIANSRGMEGEELTEFNDSRTDYRKTLLAEAEAVGEPDATTQDGATEVFTGGLSEPVGTDRSAVNRITEAIGIENSNAVGLSDLAGKFGLSDPLEEESGDETDSNES